MNLPDAVGIDLSDRCTVTRLGDATQPASSRRTGGVGASVRLLDSNGPVVADLDGRSPIGSGLAWPPNSRISGDRAPGRLPVSIAWEGLHSDGTAPSQALGSGLASVTRAALVESGDSAPSALVIPNTMSGLARRTLLLEFVADPRPRLIWRPIAATLAWIEQYGSAIRRSTGDGDSIGFVLSIHLGLDGLESALVEVRRYRFGRRSLLLPARRLPSSEDPPLSLGPSGLVEHISLRITDEELPRAWNLLWCSDWLGQSDKDRSCTLHTTQELDQLKQEAARLLFERIEQHRSKTWHPLPPSELANLRSRLSGGVPLLEHRFKDWVDRTRALASTPKGPIIGVTATGAYAECLSATDRLDSLLAGFDIPNARLVVSSSDQSPLSRGAALFASRVSIDEPGYLDTLPKIETLVTRRGEPQWLDLTAQEGKSEEDRFVVGGSRFDELVPDQELGVAQGEERLHLTLSKEDENFVKETTVELPGPIAVSTRVQLRVLMDPGQGSPRLVIVPDVPNAFGGRSVEIDWEDAPPGTKTKEEALAEVPRTNPPLEPRLASRDAWQGWDFFQNGGGGKKNTRHANVRDALETFLTTRHVSKTAVASALAELRELLRQNDRAYLDRRPKTHATAFSSFGSIAADASDPSDVAGRFKRRLVELIDAESNPDVLKNALRCAGYCGLRSPEVQGPILRDLASGSWPTSEELILIGNTFSTKRECRAFLQLIASVDDLPSNDIMRAIARVLQYREDALEEVPSIVCDRLTVACHRVLAAEVRSGSAKYKFRHASLCIVYLLRRRRYDDGFMNPEEPLAEDVKSTFDQAIGKFKRGRMEAVGGFVDLPRVMRTLIDYIDRRGRGRLTDLIE